MKSKESKESKELEALAARAMSKATTQLIMNQPFFGSLALNLVPVPADIPTAATDGYSLKYNPSYVLHVQNTQGKDRIMGLVAHEVLHCAMTHVSRFAGRINMTALIATDISINPIIRDAGLRLPDGCLFPAAFNLPEGKSAEEYYRLLSDKKDEVEKYVQDNQPPHCIHIPPNGKGEGKGKGKVEAKKSAEGVEEGDGEGKNGSGKAPSPSDLSRLAREWEINVFQAAHTAKLAGKLPAQLERLVENIGKPSVHWRDQLQQFLVERSKDDYRMFPPNRRFLWSGLYMASLANSENMGEMCIAVDTSGSIGQREFDVFMAEILAIVEFIRPSKLHVVSCDYEVQGWEAFTPDDYPITAERLRKAIKGGGGTRVTPVFELIEEQQLNLACLVYLTDMELYDWPNANELSYPVLWVATTDAVAPTSAGETIHIKV
jgi:predicted metal-dependent peptidase